MFAWIHSVAVHSPNLDVTSPVPDCGKTTLLGVLSYLTPRPYKVVEITCGNLHRIVDRHHPTLFVDEADNLLLQKELRAILNASWTKGTKVPRMTNGQLHEYDVFCPKIICGKSLVMADTTATRGILIKLWPKLPDEEVDDFDHEDNAEFVVLRRKLTRWTQDNIARLKAARPIMPTGFDNRLAKNWKLLFAVADLAGGDYPQRARTAAIKLSHKRLAPSEGLRLFEVLDPMVRNRDVIPSAEIIERLTAAEDSEWREYGRGREPISQRGLAMLLEQFDIGPPGVIHPSRRSDDSRRGYRCDQIRAVIARLLPQAHKRTLKPKKPRKKP
jgi:putative DNA primase/helicase